MTPDRWARVIAFWGAWAVTLILAIAVLLTLYGLGAMIVWALTRMLVIL